MSTLKGEMQSDPYQRFLLVVYHQVTLANGLRVFLLEDHEVPVVKGTLAMRGGQRASPPEKVRSRILVRLVSVVLSGMRESA